MKYEKKIIKMSIQLASEELNIPEPAIGFSDYKTVSSESVACIYNKKNNKLIYNEKWLINASEVEIIITTFHEVRHAYQYYSVINNKNQTTEVLQQWKTNFENYISPTSTLNEEMDQEYLTQPIEKDAIYWTHDIIYKLFEIRTILPKILRRYD